MFPQTVTCCSIAHVTLRRTQSTLRKAMVKYRATFLLQMRLWKQTILTNPGHTNVSFRLSFTFTPHSCARACFHGTVFYSLLLVTSGAALQCHTDMASTYYGVSAFSCGNTHFLKRFSVYECICSKIQLCFHVDMAWVRFCLHGNRRKQTVPSVKQHTTHFTL